MKNFTISLIIMLALFSCSSHFEDDKVCQEDQTVTFIASQESGVSKTSVSDNIVYWSPKEEINIFFESSPVKFVSTNSEKATTVAFVGAQPYFIGSSENTNTSPIMGLYPYDENATCSNGYITTTLPNVQVAADNTFDDNIFPTIAQTTSDNYSLGFYNVCGGLKFKVGKEGIKKVIVSSNNGEKIAGKFKVHFGDSGYPETEIVEDGGKSEVILTSKEGLAIGDTDFYIVMLPGVLENGITIRLETYSEYAEMSYAGRREIKRSVWSNLGEIDSDVWHSKLQNPLTFTSTGNTTISLQKEGSPYSISLMYNKNNDSWNSYTIGQVISLANGETVSFQAENGGNSNFSLNDENYYHFFMDGNGTLAASENIMSLLDNTLEQSLLPDSCFYSLFRSCTSLTKSPELPATTLASSCYYSMFYGCTSLTQAPELLPATTLEYACYHYMFYGCTSLTQAPELPATTLAPFCYGCMFVGCTSLTQAPELPATTLESSCYSGMFDGCTSLTQAPELPATTLADQCYSGMFYRCTSLTQAPELLPATTLEHSCYCYMFYGCTSLTQAPELPATTLADLCYGDMFEGCTSLTQAPELPATTLASLCYLRMFYGCSSLTQAPELPASKLTGPCYNQMFAYCSNLNYVKCLASEYSDGSAITISRWMVGVSSTGTFVKASGVSWPTGESGIPSGWTVETAK